MELTVSKNPLKNNSNCAYCGKVFSKNGFSLQLEVDHKMIDLPICPSCFDRIPRFEATVNLEQGYARLKR
jgi:hypothetical protein